MALNLKISTALRNAIVTTVASQVAGGTGAGRIEIRTGAPPTNVSDVSSGTKLGTLTFNATPFGAASNGVITANAIVSDTDADASGVAGYFRVYAGAAADTASLFQGTAGEVADTPNMVFDNKTIVAGGTIAINSFTVTMPIQ